MQVPWLSRPGRLSAAAVQMNLFAGIGGVGAQGPPATGATSTTSTSGCEVDQDGAITVMDLQRVAPRIGKGRKL